MRSINLHFTYLLTYLYQGTSRTYWCTEADSAVCFPAATSDMDTSGSCTHVHWMQFHRLNHKATAAAFKRLFQGPWKLNRPAFGSSINDVRKNRPPSPCPLLSTLGHTSLPLLRTSTYVTKYTVNSDCHGHPVITRCSWVTAVGTGRTQCWLQAVSG